MTKTNDGGSPFDEPIGTLKGSDPEIVAERTGASWAGGGGEGRLILPVLNDEIAVTFPGIELGVPPGLDSFTIRLLAVIYLANSAGREPTGKWISFRELPNGRFYEPVVSRSAEEPLAAAYGEDLEGFAAACLALGGKREEFGDASYSFRLFPGVVICFVIWGPDEEFPARAKVLFDSACPKHLNAFELRMGAQDIAGKLIKRKSG